MPAILIPILLGALFGGIGAGASAYGTEQANQRQAQGLDRQRQAILNWVSQLENQRAPQGLVNQAVNAAKGSHALAGTLQSGVGANDILSAATGVVSQDMLQRYGMISNLLQNPSLGAPDPNTFNPGLAGFFGFLGGAAGGAGQGASGFMGTESGTNALLGAFGLGPQPIPIPQASATVLSAPYSPPPSPITNGGYGMQDYAQPHAQTQGFTTPVNSPSRPSMQDYAMLLNWLSPSSGGAYGKG